MSTDNNALEVLRGVWSADGKTVDGLEAIDDPKICKRTEGLDFGNFGDADGVGSNGDLRSAWRSKLAREGKLASGPQAISVRELGLGAEAETADVEPGVAN
jgi:hypothetical protein